LGYLRLRSSSLPDGARFGRRNLGIGGFGEMIKNISDWADKKTGTPSGFGVPIVVALALAATYVLLSALLMVLHFAKIGG